MSNGTKPLQNKSLNLIGKMWKLENHNYKDKCWGPIAKNRLRFMNVCFFVCLEVAFPLLLRFVISNASVFSWSILCSSVPHNLSYTIRSKRNLDLVANSNRTKSTKICPIITRHHIMSYHHTAPHYSLRSFRSRFVNLLNTSHSNNYVPLHCGRTAQTAVPC
jgi:hypothetical protein